MANEELKRKILAGYQASLETYEKRLADKQASKIFDKNGYPDRYKDRNEWLVRKIKTLKTKIKEIEKECEN